MIKSLRSSTAAAAASAAASKCDGSSKVSKKDFGEMKEKEKRVQFFVKYGSTSSVVRSSSLDVVSDVLQLYADEYAVCGSRLIRWRAPSVKMVLGMVRMCKCCDVSVVV